MAESENETTQISTKAQLQMCGLTLSLTRMAWTKLMAYCRATNMETSGFMLLERDGDDLMVDEIYLLPQESTGTSTEMDRTAIAKFQLDLYKKGIIGKRDSKKKLAHWHTHPTFGVFWSGTDMEMRRLNSQGVDYFVSIVVNQKGDALAAIDINGEFSMSINDLPIEIVDNDDVAKIIQACKAEVELKVKSPTTTWGGSDGYHGYNYKSGRTFFNPETRQWQDTDPTREQLVLGNDPPTISDKPAAEAAARAVEQLRLLGPGDRRSRKAIKHLERLTKKMSARAGKQSYEDWKKDQVRLDAARQAVHLASAGELRKSRPAALGNVLAGADEGEISILEDSVVEKDIITSDESGIYQNIGGEVVRTDRQTGEDYFD